VFGLVKSIEHNPNLEYSKSTVVGAKGHLRLAELVNAKKVWVVKGNVFSP